MNQLCALLGSLLLVSGINVSGEEVILKSSSDPLDYYQLDSIPLPPGESSVDAVAFLPDGRLVCSLSLSKIYFFDVSQQVWSLFAEGLHTPLGILPIDGHRLLVAQRPEMTLISDEDKNGKADRFETISDSFGLSGNYAEFSFGPVGDAQGDLFFGLGTGSAFGGLLTDEVRGLYSPEGHEGRMNSCVPYRGWIMRVDSGGVTHPWANGFREPNGMGVDGDGNLFVTDNQGDFVGSSKLYHVREGGFYGHPHSLVWRAGENRRPFDIPVSELDARRTRGAIVFPHGEMANSPTQPVVDMSGGRFGPFTGQMFLGEMNFSRLIRVMLENVGGELQGACIPFFDHAGLGFGSNRLAFSPSDGSLWVGQTKHKAWVGGSGLKRLKWNGVTPLEVKTMTLTESGFDLGFTRAVHSDVIDDLGKFEVESYFYNYQEKYGSEKYDVTREGIQEVSLSSDGRTLSLKLEELKPWRLYDFRLNGIVTPEGIPLLNPWFVYTLNRLVKETPPPPEPRPNAIPRRTVPRVPVAGVKSVGGPREFVSWSTKSDVRVTRVDGGFRFSENGRPILTYRRDPVSRKDGNYKRGHYIHPLYDLDGALMTHDMPKDHPHHRGVFWAWTQLWIDAMRIGHPWEQRDLWWDVRDVRLSSDADSSAIEVDVQWKSPLWTDREGNEKPIVEERALIRVFEAGVTHRLIDFEIQLRGCENNVRLGGSLDTKGYGGFSARIPLPGNLQILGPAGSVAENRSQPSSPQPWVDFCGDFGGQGEMSGLAILTHPSSPGFPQGWTIRRRASCQNPVFPGREPILLPRTQPLILRYRLVLHRGDVEEANIAEHYKEYMELE